MGKIPLLVALLFLAAIIYAPPPSGGEEGGPRFSDSDLDRMASAQARTFDLVKKCEASSFDPPDPENKVSKISIFGLEGGKCKVSITNDAGEATYLLPQEVYTKISKIDDLTKGECTGACDSGAEVTKPPEPKDEGEACMRACVVKDCTLGEMACEKQNKEKCEEECGMLNDAPDLESMSPEQRCIFECVSRVDKKTICGPSKEGETGNELCQKCAKECEGLYEGPCLGEGKLEEKKKACQTCAYCYGQPVMGDSGQGYECIVDVKCGDASSEWGDNPGTGPDSYEPGHEPGSGNAYWEGYESSLELEGNQGTLVIENRELENRVEIDISAGQGVSLEEKEGRLVISQPLPEGGSPQEKIEIENNLEKVVFTPQGRQRDIEKITVKLEDKKPVYEYNEREKARLLGFIPIDKEVRKKVDAENLKVLEKEEPWWSVLAPSEN